MIVAPLGISNKNDATKPTIEETAPKIIERIVILKNVDETSLAEAAGITRNAAIKTIPTSFIESTIETAISMDNM